MPFPFYIRDLGRFHAYSRIIKNNMFLFLEDCETTTNLQINDCYDSFQVINSFKNVNSLELYHFARNIMGRNCNIALIISDEFKMVVRPSNQQITYSSDPKSFNLSNFINILHQIKQVDISESSIHCIMIPFYIHPGINSFLATLNSVNQPEIPKFSNPPYCYNAFETGRPEQNANDTSEYGNQGSFNELLNSNNDIMEPRFNQSLSLINNNLMIKNSFISIAFHDLSPFIPVSTQCFQLYTTVKFINCTLSIEIPLSYAHLLSSLSIKNCIGEFSILGLFKLQCEGAEKVHFKSVEEKYSLIIDNSVNLIVFDPNLLGVEEVTELDI